MGNANMPNLVTRSAQIIKNIWRSGNFLQGRNLLNDVYIHFMDTSTTLTDGAIPKSSSITSFVMLGNDGVPTTSHFEVLVSYGWASFGNHLDLTCLGCNHLQKHLIALYSSIMLFTISFGITH